MSDKNGVPLFKPKPKPKDLFKPKPKDFGLYKDPKTGLGYSTTPEFAEKKGWVPSKLGGGGLDVSPKGNGVTPTPTPTPEKPPVIMGGVSPPQKTITQQIKEKERAETFTITQEYQKVMAIGTRAERLEAFKTYQQKLGSSRIKYIAERVKGGVITGAYFPEQVTWVRKLGEKPYKETIGGIDISKIGITA